MDSSSNSTESSMSELQNEGLQANLPAVPTSIEISQKAKLLPINRIASLIGIRQDEHGMMLPIGSILSNPVTAAHALLPNPWAIGLNIHNGTGEYHKKVTSSSSARFFNFNTWSPTSE